MELGPDGVLAAMVGQSRADAAAAVPTRAPARPSRRRCSPPWPRLHVARRATVDWAAVFAGDRRAAGCELPTYAFQRRRYWLEATQRRAYRGRPARPADATEVCVRPRWSRRTWPVSPYPRGPDAGDGC